MDVFRKIIFFQGIIVSAVLFHYGTLIILKALI